MLQMFNYENAGQSGTDTGRTSIFFPPIPRISAMMKILNLCLAVVFASTAAHADGYKMPSFEFESIDGGVFNTKDWQGKPILIVNTASMCGFTPQYTQMQKVHETYGDAGLVVLAVPSDDFNQEKDTVAEVKEFCEVTFGLTLPMTTIAKVKRGDIHPFYKWMKEAHRWTPKWNFNKVLIGPEGDVLGTWGSPVKPDSRQITDLIKAELSM